MKSISKSQYNRSLQCKKAFYLYRHRKDLLEYTSTQQKVMQQGTSFGIYMQQLFPGGVDVSQAAQSFGQKISLTKALISEGKQPIYEATLSANSFGVPLLCMVDILVPGEGGWHLYEVKSATSVKPEYITDAGFQQFVAQQMGVHVLSVNIIHVNNQYVRNGAIEIDKLGEIAEITANIKKAAIDVESELKELKGVDALTDSPEVGIGAHCDTPYGCGFKNHCWKNVTKEDSVFEFFSTAKAFELYNQGMQTMPSIPESYPFSGKIQTRFQAYIKKELLFNSHGVQAFIDELTYPLYYLDFETFMSAIPPYNTSRPYQQLCFQYSLHIQSEANGNCIHKAFLANPDEGDSRIPFITQLINDIGSKGSVIVYNIAFERKRLEEIGENFPEYAEACASINSRMIDLYIPFRDLDIYHPSMKGSASIKSVLPALVPALSYADLEVSQGGQAMDIYGNMVNHAYSSEEVKKLRKGLLEYCKLDTWAMVKLVEWLLKKRSA